jgi:hypothetical protein
MMPIAESYVYIVTQTDFEDHTDEEGRLAILSVHATAALANSAVKDYICEFHELEDDEVNDFIQDNDNTTPMTNGLYEVTIEERSDYRHAYLLKVEKMELEGHFPDPSLSDGGNGEGKKRTGSKRQAESPPSDGRKKPRQDVIVLD